MDHSDAIAESIRWAASYQGQNIGPQVFGELGERRPSGTAWCAGFVRDVLLHAGIKTPESWDGVDAIRNWAHHNGLLRESMAGVQPGDIVGINGEHTAIVASVHGNVVTTVAGNSLAGGHTVQVQQLGGYWKWHVHMAPVIHGHVLVAGGVAASTVQVATVHGGGAAGVHLAAMLHGAAVLTALHFVAPVVAVAALFRTEGEAAPVFDGQYPSVNLITNMTDRLTYKPPGGWGGAL